MSGIYDIDEKFEIPSLDKNKHTEFCNVLSEHFKDLYDYTNVEAEIHEFIIKSDGVEFNFAEAAFEDMMAAFNNAKNSIEVSLFYTYTWRTEVKESVGFESWIAYVEKADDTLLSTIFCRLYNYADCADDTGCIAAFGSKNGKIYHGDIPFVAIPSAPEGHWRTELTAVMLDDDYTEEQIHKLIPLCKRLEKLSSADTFVIDGTFDYCMNNLEFSSPTDFMEYINCVEQISSLLGSNEFMGKTEFVNINDFRMVRIITDGAKAVGFEISEL